MGYPEVTISDFLGKDDCKNCTIRGVPGSVESVNPTSSIHGGEICVSFMISNQLENVLGFTTEISAVMASSLKTLLSHISENGGVCAFKGERYSITRLSGVPLLKVDYILDDNNKELYKRSV